LLTIFGGKKKKKETKEKNVCERKKRGRVIIRRLGFKKKRKSVGSKRFS